jgi:hypothetical protein
MSEPRLAATPPSAGTARQRRRPPVHATERHDLILRSLRPTDASRSLTSPPRPACLR